MELPAANPSFCATRPLFHPLFFQINQEFHFIRRLSPLQALPQHPQARESLLPPFGSEVEIMRNVGKTSARKGQRWELGAVRADKAGP